MTSGICSASRAITVLFVDDDEDTRFAYRLIATEQGMDVEVAADCHEAIAVANVVLPDVIVLDLGLESADGLDGFEVARRLRATARTCGIPIVIVSGTTNARNDAQVRALGCDGFLVKPCSADGLLGLVTALARNRAEQAPAIAAVG
jgi:two-component system CheB/CheR fusion protein